MLRADPGEHRRGTQRGRDPADQVGTGPDPGRRVGREKADTAADCLRSRGVVAGHHRDPDAGIRKRRQDRGQVVARWVTEGHQPDEREPGGQVVANQASAALEHDEQPRAFSGALGHPRPGGICSLGTGHDRQQHVGCPFDDHQERVTGVVAGRHPGPVAVERDLVHAGVLLAHPRGVQAAPVRQGDESRFRGVPDGAPPARLRRVRLDLGVVAQRNVTQQPSQP